MVSKPVFKGHPAFGLPEEFLPSVKLGDIDGKDSEHLKIGVGKVVRHGASIYSDSAEELFKWSVSTSAAAGLAKASFRQAGRAGGIGYDLEKTASLDDSEPGLLKISGILRNTGEKPLSGEVYAHPFLPFEGSFSCWFAVAAAAPARPSDIPLESRRSIEVAKPHASYEVVAQEAYPKGSWLVAGGDGRDGVFAIRPEGAPWLKIRFWRMDGVYAAEPFLAFSIAPGESFSWSWTVFAAAK